MKVFTYAEALETIAQLKVATSSTLIGGQALNYWCCQFPTPELEPYEPLASKDIDFQGTYEDAEECARQLGVTAERPASKNTEARVGWVHFKHGTFELRLDFLGAPIGLTREDVEKLRVPVAPEIHETQEPRELWVMHPYHCLVSRTWNVTDLPKTYRNEHGLNQLRASVVMLRQFIKGVASAQGERAALRVCKLLFAFAKTPQGLEVHANHGIDVFAAIPVSVLGANFAQKGHPRWVAELEAARERHKGAPLRIV